MEKSKKDKIWDEVASSYDKVSTISKAHIEKFDRVIDILLKYGPKKVLDVGCGSGILEKKLIERGFKGEIEAIDNSEEMLSIAQKLIGNIKDVNFKLFDLNKPLSYGKDYFDCVVAINVLFLLEKPKEFLKDVSRVLKTGGRFILVNPKPKGDTVSFFKEQFKGLSFLGIFKNVFSNIWNLPSVLRTIILDKKLERLSEKGLIHYQDFDEIKNMLETAGFKIEFSGEIQAKQNWIFVGRKA